ncbi:MAG: hypothetical protein M1282_17730 [Chloroflexi bacterium]|nr:hypothetical protein [Chloroflexota bacterium]
MINIETCGCVGTYVPPTAVPPAPTFIQAAPTSQPTATPYPTAIFGTPPPTPYIDRCSSSSWCPNGSYCCINKNNTAACCPIGPVTPPGGNGSPPPACAISASPASMNYSNSSTISWSSTNAGSCTVQQPGWTGTSGAQSTGVLASSTTYTEVCSGPGGSCSAQAFVTVIPPANQTSVVSGVLRQKSGIGCYQADALNNFNVANLSGTTGDNCVTASCAVSPTNLNALAYSCTVTWDNQACVAQGRQPNTTQTLTINAAAAGYSSGQFSGASCALNGTSLAIVSGVNNSSADIAFPFTGNNWIKLKNSSFNGVSITGITVPAFITSYDADDDGTKYFILKRKYG